MQEQLLMMLEMVWAKKDLGSSTAEDLKWSVWKVI